MTDLFTREKRSTIMQAIQGKNTKPELVVRKTLHRLGYRFRLHRRDLPGNPDLVFPGRRKVLFVHGCFWHRHGCRKGQSMPSTRIRFWQKKFEANRLRDAARRRELKKLGWSVMTVWECQLIPRRLPRTTERMIGFLQANRSKARAV